MKYVLIGLVAVIYIIGIWMVKFLDDCVPDRYRENPLIHYIILIIMWVITPVIMIWFLIEMVVKKGQIEDPEL